MTKKKKSPRTAAIQKAQQRKAEAAGKKLGKQSLTQGILAAVDEKLRQFSSGANQTLQTILNIAVSAGQNVTALAKSHDDLNDQFAVLVRLIFSRMNQLIELQNRVYELAVSQVPEGERPENPEEHVIPLLTYEEINGLFSLFDQFKKRSDYKDHFRVWYTGGDLNDLPPPPEPKVKEETADAPEDQEVPEGAEVFGGDYDGQNGNGSEETEAERAETEAGTPDQVSELRGIQDGGEDLAGNHEPEGSVVPSLQP